MQSIPKGLAINFVVQQLDSDSTRGVSSYGIPHALYLSLVCLRTLQETTVAPQHLFPVTALSRHLSLLH